MSEPTAEEFRERLAKARADADAAIMGLIWLELGEVLTAQEAREDQAAAALREASEALAEPEAGLAVIDAEIAKAELAAFGLVAQVDDDDDNADPDAVALIRLRLQEWERRITRLRSKRDFAQSAMQPLVERRDHARKTLANIQAVKQGIMWAQLNPFASPVAQATKSYIGYRMPYLNPVLLKGDRSDPEWDLAIAELEELQAVVEQTPAQAAAMMTASMADISTSPPEPAPSAGELAKLLEAEMTNKALEGIRDHVEDLRYAPPRGAVPVQKPSYMEVPRIGRDYLR